jgi:uncharacterized protein YndB with AHSA1/START domain
MQCEIGTELDPRVGGRLRPPAGEVYKLLCEYREIERPRRLVFTFVWVSHPGHGHSLVTVELHPLGTQGTEVKFRQEGFATVQARREHERGWIEWFDVLDKNRLRFWRRYPACTFALESHAPSYAVSRRFLSRGGR